MGLNLGLKITHGSAKSFNALVGPLPSAAIGSSTILAANEVGTETSRLVELALLGEDGFIYMSGFQPYGGTDGGSATSDGTVMIIQRITEAGTTATDPDANKRKVGQFVVDVLAMAEAALPP